MPTHLSPAERSQRARQGAHALHAAGKTNTAPARAAFEERFLDAVDPDRVLDPEVRAKRAAHARKAYFADLARKSARARRLAAEAKRGEAA